MRDITVSAGYASALLEFCVGKGAVRTDLAHATGLDLAMLSDRDARIALSIYRDLMRAGQVACRDPALALHFGEALALSDLSIVGLIALASQTMGEALGQLNRFGRLVIDYDGASQFDRFTNEADRRGLWMIDRRADANSFPELTESTFARMVCEPRRFGVTGLPLEVHVTHPAPAYAAEYERIFAAPVFFNSTRNAMLVDASLPQQRVAQQPRYVFGVLSDHAQDLMDRLILAKSFRGRVESLLLPSLHTGQANVDAIAKELAVSRQTLYRKLKAEGATFAEVLEGLRHKMALHYLQGRRVSVNETAYLVGFSEPAAFSRAFKRWTGKSPKEMRGG